VAVAIQSLLFLKKEVNYYYYITRPASTSEKYVFSKYSYVKVREVFRFFFFFFFLFYGSFLKNVFVFRVLFSKKYFVLKRVLVVGATSHYSFG